MLLKIAWKNIWRNPLRSGVVMTSVLIGVSAGLFIIAFANGMNEQRLKNQLDNFISHLRIQHPRYGEEFQAEFTLQQSEELQDYLQQKSEVQHLSARTLSVGMAVSSSGNYGVTVRGVDTVQEKAMTYFDERLVAGGYLGTYRRNPVFVGEKLAKRLSLKPRSKLVLTFQDAEGELTSAAFRVTGIFKSQNTRFDESNVFVRQDDLQRLLGVSAPHEIALTLQNYETAARLQTELQARFPDAKIETWTEIAPELRYLDDMMSSYLYIFMGVIILALSLGIINTMLMAILERTRELGMLMAIGMSKRRIFGMILTETILLALTGIPFGLLLMGGLVAWLGRTGINMAYLSDALSAYGYSSRVYPFIEPNYYLQVTLMVLLASVLAAIYPALRALKLNPAEAIRK